MATVMPVGGGGGSRVRERAGGEEEGEGELERCGAAAWLRPGHRGREKEAGGGQQGGRWRARVPASVGHTPSSFCPRMETTEGSGGGLGRQLERGQVSGPVAFPSLFICVFLFLLFCFDLV